MTGQIFTTLIFQLYGLAFLVLGFIVLLIPKKDMNLSFCRHAAWLSAFGILHGPIAFIAGATLNLNDSISPWIIVTLVGASFFSLMEFARRLWNDALPATQPKLSPWLHLILVLPNLYLAYIASDPRAGLAVGFRVFLGLPATLLTGLALLNQVRENGFNDNDKTLVPWLKFTAIGFLAFALFTPFVATVDPGLDWVPTIAEFESFTGVPIQVPRMVCAVIMASGFAFLLHNSTNMLVIELAKTTRLEEEENKYRSLFEMTPDAIVTLDGTRIIDCNQAALQLFGASSKQQIIGLTPSDLAPPFQPGNVKSDELAFSHGKHAYIHQQSRFEFLHKRFNGEEFPARITLTLMNIGGKKVLQGIIYDITEQRNAEQEISRHREHLQELVDERTADLNLALQVAEKANKAKSIFLSNMSHEFRTPLNAILGYSQLLQLKAQETPHFDDDHFIDEIYNAGSHLLSLVNDLLDLNRIETGNIELQFTRIAVQSLIEECTKQLLPLANQRGITITVSCDASHAVRADPVRLKQVVINLLNNAIKYNRAAGSVSITSSLTETDSIMISFSDTGNGIAKKHLDKMFKPFERIDSQEEAVEGTGIGLALSKNIIEAMHGSIGMASKVGQGSTFWLQLPRTEESILTNLDNGKAVALPPESNTSRTLLYIEDNVPSIRLVERIISRRRDLHLLTASNGRDGLAMATEHKPDLILLDINLPEMNGYTVLSELSQNADTKAIPVIALSGNALSEDIERGLKAGFSDYLTKPFDIKHLLETINGLLGK